MSRNSRIEEERADFIDWKSSISCSGDPCYGDEVWNVIMDGPKDSPYIFEFLTPICHINIDGTHICLESLNNYQESYSIVQILTQIFMMLTSPNENSAYGKYKDLYINSYTEYLAKAREMTSEYAK